MLAKVRFEPFLPPSSTLGVDVRILCSRRARQEADEGAIALPRGQGRHRHAAPLDLGEPHLYALRSRSLKLTQFARLQLSCTAFEKSKIGNKKITSKFFPGWEVQQPGGRIIVPASELKRLDAIAKRERDAATKARNIKEAAAAKEAAEKKAKQAQEAAAKRNIKVARKSYAPELLFPNANAK